MTAETPVGPSLSLEEILDLFARDVAAHIVGTPAGEQDLANLEQAVGGPLPRSFRAFLSRFGGGLFYQGHEIFGPRRVIIHDIELVPSLPVILRQRGQEFPAGVVPFHRVSGLLHLFDLRPESTQPDRITSLPAGSTYPDLAHFLQAVVLPRP
jgi:hypothetical protein